MNLLERLRYTLDAAEAERPKELSPEERRVNHKAKVFGEVAAGGATGSPAVAKALEMAMKTRLTGKQDRRTILRLAAAKTAPSVPMSYRTFRRG